jgi:WD40 repeat protein
MTLKLVIVILVGLLLIGCSGSKSFKPKKVFVLNAKASSYKEQILSQNRYGATLVYGHFIDKYGVSKIVLPRGFVYLNSSKNKILCSSDNILRIIDRKTAKVIADIKTNVPTISATMRGNLVAYISNDNSFGLYNIKTKKTIVKSDVGDSIAINAKAAAPIFVDNLVVMPMLDGKLVIVDINNIENINKVYISSDGVFNNIIYLSRIGDNLVAATQYKVITLGTIGEFEYASNLSDVAINKGYIYLFGKNGEIIKLDIKLNKIASAKFDYARYSAVSAFDDKVVALDKTGALIVLSSDLKKHRIYDMGEVKNPVYINANKLYKDGKIIDLSKISYE